MGLTSRTRSSRRKVRELTRSERSQKQRAALFNAAVRVVGRYGYAGATIARITAAAGVAQGSFYTYFRSRQALLDELLPALGNEMLAFIAAAVGDERDEIRREEKRFRAFFEFLQRRPAFFRILNEAEFSAPRGFRRHFENIAANYCAALQRARRRGSLAGFAEDEIEPLVYLLMAARSYTSMRYAYAPGGRVRPPPEALLRAYVKLLRFGLEGRPHPPAEADTPKSEP
jgi:AcrR family transcriptional regulator